MEQKRIGEVSDSIDIQNEFISRIEKHQGILHRICFVYAGKRSNQKDLYQEMVLQLWKSYPSFMGRSDFSTWMYRVALNTAITLTRKERYFDRMPQDDFLTFDTEQAMNYSEDLKILYCAISKLNKIEKAIIMMWLDEKCYEEIAETIGISVKHVSVKLVRIKNKLSKIIQRLQ